MELEGRRGSEGWGDLKENIEVVSRNVQILKLKKRIIKDNAEEV
jgi:hypothetical protein